MPPTRPLHHPLRQTEDGQSQLNDSPQTRRQAPHKALLLLTVLDLFAEDAPSTNLIALDEMLLDLFAGYWARVMSPPRRGNIAMPFFHLQSDGFWHLCPRPGREITGKVHAVTKLNELVLGARLDEALYALLCHEESREALRRVLIQSYFDERSGRGRNSTRGR
ncbi:MAG: hypothetical protein R2856_38015 [Caldilineaceae bacterium]